MDDHVWNAVTGTYAELFEQTAPRELLQAEHMDAEAARAMEVRNEAQEATAAANDAFELASQKCQEKLMALEELAAAEAELRALAVTARRRITGGGNAAGAEAEAALADEQADAQAAEKDKAHASYSAEAKELERLEAVKKCKEDEEQVSTEELERKQSERERMLRFRGVRCKCVVQLLLIDSCEETFFKHGAMLSASQIAVLLDALTSCHEFARDFNADVELRNQLWSQGFMKKVSAAAASVCSTPYQTYALRRCCVAGPQLAQASRQWYCVLAEGALSPLRTGGAGRWGGGEY
jgi:hypothetical protein